MDEMTKRERLMAAVTGDPVDRAPASYYFHYHPAERSAKSNVQHLLEQQRKFDWDFIKVQLGAHYYGQGWGCTYKEDPLWGPQIDKHIIYEAKDYRKLEKLDITQGPFGEQLRVAQMLNETLKGSIPFIQTTFSPLSVAGRMAGAKNRDPAEAEPIKNFMKEDPESLHYGLEIISQTLADYARKAVCRGADGMRALLASPRMQQTRG